MPSIVFSCMFAPFPLRRRPAAGSGSVKTAAAVLPDRRGRFSAAQPSTSAAADAPGSSCKVGLLTCDRGQKPLRSRLPSQLPNGGLSSSAAGAAVWRSLSHTVPARFGFSPNSLIPEPLAKKGPGTRCTCSVSDIIVRKAANCQSFRECCFFFARFPANPAAKP